MDVTVSVSFLLLVICSSSTPLSRLRGTTGSWARPWYIGVGEKELTKGCSTDQFPYSQTESPLIHRTKSRKDIRTPIAKSQERNTRRRLAQSEVVRDGSEVRTEEIRGDDPNEREQEGQQEEVSSGYHGFESGR